MSKDKRVKSCPNLMNCERATAKVKYAPTDIYCSLCGSELVFVCKKCGKKIENLGPEHFQCAVCSAEKDDLKNNREKRKQRNREKIGNVMSTAKGKTEQLANQAKESIDALGERAEEAIHRLPKLPRRKNNEEEEQ